MRADETTRTAVLDAMNSLIGAYERRDVDGAMAHIAPDDDVVVIGTGADEKRIGSDEAREQLERDLAQSERITMDLKDPLVSAAGDVAWMSADLTMEGEAGGEPFAMSGRMTAVFEQRDGDWLVVQSHSSVPMAGQAEGDSFPS